MPPPPLLCCWGANCCCCCGGAWCAAGAAEEAAAGGCARGLLPAVGFWRVAVLAAGAGAERADEPYERDGAGLRSATTSKAATTGAAITWAGCTAVAFPCPCSAVDVWRVKPG
jgi:hypothetical protein